MQEPKLSVCVVTYNQEKYIAQALDSFLAQKTDFPFQVIVGDDASTDGTPAILREYAEKYPDIIKPILHEKNRGPIHNSLSVYDAAKTDYVAICDGDDYWIDENKLQKQVDFLETHPHFSICYHVMKIVVEEMPSEVSFWPSKDYRFNKEALTIEELAQRNPMGANTVVYRWRFKNENIRDLMPDNICPGDYFLALLHAEKGYIGFIDEVMSVYRRNTGGISADLMLDESKTWEKLGFMELNFHKAVEEHLRYKLERFIRPAKIERCKGILKAFIKNNDVEKLKKYENEYPKYYELALENLYTSPSLVQPAPDHSAAYISISQTISQAVRKKIRKVRRRASAAYVFSIIALALSLYLLVRELI